MHRRDLLPWMKRRKWDIVIVLAALAVLGIALLFTAELVFSRRIS